MVEKYKKQTFYVVRETAEIYENYVKPLYIETMDMDHVQWVYNVIDGSREKELTVFRNELFTLQLDYKFNRGDIETLYLLALPI